jgi:antitoxin ParD1/3/4
MPIESTRQKVDAAIRSLEQKGGMDGETAVNQLLDKFQQARQSQQ